MTTEPSPLDLAHAAMVAAPEDDAARLRFHERLVDAELYLLLEAEPAGADLDPTVFTLAAGRFVMAFDREERLAAFCNAPAAYAALPGRVIVQTLQGQGVGLGLNLGVAPSAFLMPPETLDWLAGVIAHAPQDAEARPVQFERPVRLPQVLLAALAAKLGLCAGLAARALLVAARYDDGRNTHLLAFEEARSGAEAALARAVGEALVFSGIEAGEIDVVFLAAADPALPGLRAVAMRFDLPPAEPPAAPQTARVAPGSDPARPPRLR